MRKFAVTLFACTAFHAQAADVAWLPSWKANDRAVYDVERCKKSNPAKKDDACTQDRIEILVLRADDKGSLQRWRSSAVVDGLAASGLPAATIAALGKAATLALDIEFDESAQPVRLVNAAEVRDALDALLDAMLAAPVDGKPLPPEMAAATKTMMTRVTGNDQNLLTMVAKDANILYSPLGGAYPIGEKMSVRSAMPSPFGGGAIQSTITITANADGKALELQLEEDIDRASMLATMDAMLKPLMEASGKPEAAAEMKKVMAAMTLRRHSSYSVSTDSPWATQVRWQQTVEAQGRQREDSIAFKRAP